MLSNDNKCRNQYLIYYGKSDISLLFVLIFVNINLFNKIIEMFCYITTCGFQVASNQLNNKKIITSLYNPPTTIASCRSIFLFCFTSNKCHVTALIPQIPKFLLMKIQIYNLVIQRLSNLLKHQNIPYSIYSYSDHK
jgi:hypothetical protein